MKRRLIGVFCGQPFVGKTTIISSYNGSSETMHKPTFSVADFPVDKEFDGKMYQFVLKDTAGVEEYNANMPFYFRDAAIAFFVVDASVESTFESIPVIYDMVKDSAAKGFIKILLVNKIDLISEERKDELLEKFKKEYSEWSVYLTTKFDVNTIIYSIDSALKKCVDADKETPFCSGDSELIGRNEKEKSGCC